MNLVIVESPTKAKTIAKFVGKDFIVESSYGHLRDLPKSKLGIDLENNFEPQYVIPRKAQPRVTVLRKAAAKAKKTILATDPDREGEAIAWHLIQALGLNKQSEKSPDRVQRIVFHEITESAIKEALSNPRAIDTNLVDAQQARRILDRLVGYKLSPFLWKKVARGLSAGRVQSVTLRLIVEREEEIKSFKPENYWTIAVELKKPGNDKTEAMEPSTFEATLFEVDGRQIEKLDIKTEEESKKIVSDLEGADYAVLGVEKKEVGKNPLPPFTTSTLQQAASQRIGFSSKKTMFLAQKLYEDGHITYMRTDSVHVSGEALAAAASWIKNNLGKDYALPEPRVFKTKSRLAQEAHEAVRPTNISDKPESLKLEKDARRLYDLIWRRFVASQLPQAVFDSTRVEVSATSKKPPSRNHKLQANGNVMRFDGFLKIWQIKLEEKKLPSLRAQEELALEKVLPEAHQTEPPPRYNEASLIKTLEKYGIGRPSTYAPIISVIQERNYVEKNQGRFYPTGIGATVNKVLTENFPEIFNVEFTAMMEEDLDEIAEGQKKWRDVIKEFYDPFIKILNQKYEEVKKSDFHEETDIKCDLCGKPMVIKFGRFGRFLACSGYPECKNAKPLKEPPKLIGMKCPKCGEGDVIERRVSKRGRARGKIFWGCSRYPKCDYASWTNPLAPK
jgi:DNA topoisomerase-1